MWKALGVFCVLALGTAGCAMAGAGAEEDLLPGEGTGPDDGLDREGYDGPEGQDPDDFEGADYPTFPSAGVSEVAEPDPVEDDGGSGSSLCPWPEFGCEEHCGYEEREADPCEGATSVSGGVLLSDTVWDGRYCVSGTLGVRNGVTLSIEPGSEVYFGAWARLDVEGHLHAVGTDEAPILLSAAGLAPSPSDWQGIHVQLSDGGTLELRDAVVEFGEYGVATWEYAMDPTRVGPVTNVDIRETLFQYNAIGVTPDDNTALTHNTFVCNQTGISVCSEDEPVQDLRGNNICYNLVDVRATQDGADVSGSFWCTTELSVIEAQTVDERDSIDLGGLLVLEPFLDAPVPEAPPIP